MTAISLIALKQIILAGLVGFLIGYGFGFAEHQVRRLLKRRRRV